MTKMYKGLNKAQKYELDILFAKGYEINCPGFELDRICEMNDHEMFYQNAVRYLYDLYVEKHFTHEPKLSTKKPLPF